MSSSWWANKLGTPQAQPQQPQTTYPTTTQQPAYLPPDVRDHRLPVSATEASRCPGCGSGNYGRVTPEAKARCYDCGYPLVQSGSGMGKGIAGGPQASGPATPARQVASGGFNPQTIVGRIE
jgi:hypothetical protein